MRSSFYRPIGGSFVFLFAFAILQQPLEAQIFDNQYLIESFPLPDAKSASMGGSTMALSPDWTAAFNNPAALVLARRISFSSGFQRITTWSELDGTNLELPKSDNASSAISHFAMVYPVPVYRGSLVWSVAYSRNSDYEFSYRIKAAADPVEYNFAEKADESAWSFALATQLSQHFSGGISIALSKGDHRAYYAQDAVEDGELYVYEMQTRQEYDATKVSLGGILQPNDKLNIGVSLQFPAKHTIDARDLASSISYEYTTPPSLTIGAAWSEYFWALSASYMFRDFATVSDDLPDNYTEPELDNLRSMSQINLGGEVALMKSDLSLRGGFWQRTYPGHQLYWAPDLETEEPGILTNKMTLLETSRGFSLGLGYLIDEVVSFDLGLYHEQMQLAYDSVSAGSIKQYRKKSGILLSLSYKM
jgi:hypothetical protein